jgi:hypothetical protein
MGTNFYARIIPKRKRKNELKKLIDTDDFHEIVQEIGKTYGSFSVDYTGEAVGGEVHLGKRSAGWKFLWNPNIYIIRNGHSEWEEVEPGHKVHHWIEEPDTYYQVYPLTKKGIKEFIDRKDVKIFDEYGEEQDKEQFFKEAVEWTSWKGEESWDAKSYEEWEKGRDSNDRVYKCYGEYIDMLRSKGYEFTSESCSDFYSDGLRFSSHNEFC